MREMMRTMEGWGREWERGLSGGVTEQERVGRDGEGGKRGNRGGEMGERGGVRELERDKERGCVRCRKRVRRREWRSWKRWRGEDNW